MNFNKFLKILNPQPPIGGLEVSDSALKFVFFGENKPIFVSLNLPAGTVKDGKLVNKDNFKAALLNLHSQINPRAKKKIYVVLNVPDVNVYTQVFNLPMAAIGNIEEAARLNLQMISPIDFSTVYSDWQRVGEIDIDGGQAEILSAFISKKTIDEFTECLKETNFVIAAVEFPSLAISRLSSGLKEPDNSFLLLHLTASGLNFSLVRNRNLYFNHFVSWLTGEERQISLSQIQEVIIRETQKVLNFATGHWPDIQINKLLLAAPAMEEKISKIITDNFSLSVQKMILPAKLSAPDGLWSISNTQLSTLTAEWFPVLGSALRGLIPRAKDIIISLAGVGTEEEFRQQQTINFILIWRNIVLTTLSFILVVFGITDVFLRRTVNSLNNQLANLGNPPEVQEVAKLQEAAEAFNERIELGIKVKNQLYNWSSFFEKMRILTGEDILIERIFIQSQQSVLFNGRAADEKSIIDFKARLENDSEFKDINLPLAGIVSNDGFLRFTLTFKLK